MLRSLLSLAVLLALVTVTDASTITFNKATDGNSNIFTVIGDGSFTLEDSPWYMDAESTRYLVTSSNFSAKVSGFGAPDVVFEMYDAEVWPTFDALTLELRNQDHGKLWINLPMTGLVAGQAIPATLPGPNYWKALSMTDPSGTGPLLGELPGSYLSIVPEPTSMLGMLMGFAALCAGVRRR